MSRLMLAALLAAVPFAASAGEAVSIGEAYEAKWLCVRLGGDQMICSMKHPYDERFALDLAEWVRRQCMEDVKWISDQDLAKCPERLAYIKQRWGEQPR